MGVAIIGKDVSLISSITGKAKATISRVFSVSGWAGGGPASQGPQAGSTAISADRGGVDWVNPTNVYLSNNYTYCSTVYDQESNWIKATNFGFSIPTGATINGITVTLKRLVEDGLAFDIAARIVKNGSLTVGSSQPNPNNWTVISFESITYGGPSDLWGTSWTAADINASYFGFALYAQQLSGNKFPINMYLKELKIKIDYTT